MIRNFIDRLPNKFTQKVIELCEDDGIEWLNNLSKTIEKLEEKWEIKMERHFPNLSYNYVASCFQKDGTPAVLKIALPLQNVEIFNEVKTLRSFHGKGAVRVLEIDKAHEAILLERLTPGKHLKELFAENKEKAVEIMIDVMKSLYENSLAHEDFTDVDSWLNGLERAPKANFPAKQLNKARNYFEKLNSNKEKVILLHGDLHHENILSSGQAEYKAIDPFGINANPGYEIGLFLRVHMKWVNDRRALFEAVDQFSDAFEMRPIEVKQWAFVQQVLSASWDFEDGGANWREDLNLADVWET